MLLTISAYKSHNYTLLVFSCNAPIHYIIPRHPATFRDIPRHPATSRDIPRHPATSRDIPRHPATPPTSLDIPRHPSAHLTTNSSPDMSCRSHVTVCSDICTSGVFGGVRTCFTRKQP